MIYCNFTQMHIHYLAPLKVPMVKVHHTQLPVGHRRQKLLLRNLVKLTEDVFLLHLLLLLFLLQLGVAPCAGAARPCA